MPFTKDFNDKPDTIIEDYIGTNTTPDDIKAIGIELDNHAFNAMYVKLRDESQHIIRFR